jgi:hypothetical protein
MRLVLARSRSLRRKIMVILTPLKGSVPLLATYWSVFLFRWFESRIDPFARVACRSTARLTALILLVLRADNLAGVALILFFDLLAALSEVTLATFVAQLIDLMKAAATPTSFFIDHAGLLVWMAFVVLIARPAILFGYELTKSQVLSPPFQTRVRWQSHGYLLRQSLGFFQNEFPGRVANKLMQTAPALRDSFVMLSDAAVFVAMQWLSSLVLFWAAGCTPYHALDRLAFGLWRNACLVHSPHPQAVIGIFRGALDAAGAHSRQLHQHTDGEALWERARCRRFPWRGRARNPRCRRWDRGSQTACSRPWCRASVPRTA